MLIRAATVEDLDAIVAVERGEAMAPHWSRAVWQGLLADHSQRRQCLVAVVEDTVRGFAAGTCLAAEGELESVAVSRPMQGQGIGRALCLALIQRFEALGVTAVMLEVRAGSKPAFSLYQHLGFVELGRRSKYYSAPEEDAILMRLDLHVPAETP